MMIRIVFLALVLILAQGSARAQDPPAEQAAEASGPGAVSDPTWDSRYALAKKMNELNPAADQINAAIEQVSINVPARERPAFTLALRKILDFNALEEESIKAMATVFTENELKAMVEYYSKPEAKSISAKMMDYQKLVAPKITRMLDEAMMKVRTGEAGK